MYKERRNPIVSLWALAVMAKRRTIDEVPERLRNVVIIRIQEMNQERGGDSE